MLEQLLVFPGYSRIQFLIQHLSLIESMRPIGHQILPNQPLLREAEDFPRCGKYS